VENRTLTDEIYAELVDGLKTGLDWTQFLAKHSAHKPELYNAIGRFLNDMEPKVRALNEVQRKLDAAGLELDSLDQRIKEAERSLAPLEGRRNALNDQIKTLETRLAEKSELAGHLVELGKLGFDIERLKQLREVLSGIGAKHGLKDKETATKFFSDLQDYDAMIGFKREIQRLGTITSTKRLEAEKWQAEADSLARRHKDLSEAITAVQSLIKHGVKTEQIVSWNGIVSKVGGPEELKEKLEQYRSMSELLATRKKEIQDCDKRVTELGAQIKTLREQKAEIESSIKSLSTSGVKEITKVGDKAITELKSLLIEIRKETKRLTDLKAEAGKMEKELMYARYLTTGDQTVLKAFPKEVVITFLDRASVYCKLNQLNPMVRVPDGFPQKYSSIYSSTQVGLVDLIAWAEVGLVGALQ
jgi:chromosome segregation ATPase